MQENVKTGRDWIKTVLPLVQSGLQVYLDWQIKKTSASAKAIAIQSAVITFGSIALLVFLASGIVMTFVDLGNQFESHTELHFSGLMLSGLYLTAFGVLLFIGSLVLARILSTRSQKAVAPVNGPLVSNEALVMLADQLIKKLAENLEAKP